jgi:CheY-like chemotaxis protein
MAPKLKTLIVEDDKIILTLVHQVLLQKEHEVELATSAEEGRKLWEAGQHDLIILDLHLPGISGLEFCQWIKQQPEGKDTFILKIQRSFPSDWM